jgi:PAS domain S-box-containing protein
VEPEEPVVRPQQTMSPTSDQIEDFYRAWGEASPDGITVSDPAGTITYASPRAIRLYGWSSLEEALSTNVMAWVDPDDRERAARNWAARLRSESVTNHGEYRVVRKDGNRFVCAISAAVLRNADGSLRGILATHRDVTEHRRMRQALRENHQRLTSMYNAVEDIIFQLTVEPEGQFRFVSANAAFQRVTGLSLETVVGKTVNEVIPEPSLTMVLGKYRQAIEENAVVRWEETSDYPAGRRTGEVSVAPVFDNQGTCTHLVGAVHDVTAHQRVEDALRESEERYRSLFENAQMGIYRTTPGGRVVLANPSLLAMLGYTSMEELAQRNLESEGFEPGYSRGWFKEVLERDGVIRNHEATWTRRDGKTLHVLESAVAVRDPVGAVLYYEGTVQDITGRKRAEEALRQRAEELAALNTLGRAVSATLALEATMAAALQGLLEAAHPDLTLLFLCDGERLILKDVLPCASRARLGVIPEHRVGECMCGLAVREKKAIYSRDIFNDFRCTWEECKRAGFKSFAALPLISGDEVIGVIGLASGAERAFELQAGFLETLASQVSVALANAQLHETTKRELAERKQAQEALRESEERFHIIVEMAPDAIFIADRAGRFLEVNLAACRQLGLTREQLLQRSVSDIVPSRFRDEATWSLQDPKDLLESCHLRADGSEISVEVGIREVLLGGQLAFLGIARDMSERKRAEEERERLQLQLAQSQKMELVGRLAGGVAHDFNNLLTIINGYCHTLLGDLSAEDPHRGDISDILTAGERGAGLTRQLLAFSRRQVLQPECLDLNAAVGDMARMLPRLIGEEIKMVVRLEPGVPPVLADRNQIEQAIMNLAINARDAMPSGGTLTLETSQRHREGACGAGHEEIRPGNYVKLTVRDTGLGMDAHTREHVFEPFFTTKGVGRGTGLGLSMVQGIVIQSGGHMEVESELGKGSAFHIYLPIAARPMEEPNAPPLAEAAGGTETILLVEDQKNVREFIAKALRRFRYRVVAAGDGEEALRVCAEQRVDVLVTDVVMPSMSGVELARRARLVQPGLRALFISGYSEETHEREWASLGDEQILQKPFAPEALAKKVREVLERRPSSAGPSLTKLRVGE